MSPGSVLVIWEQVVDDYPKRVDKVLARLLYIFWEKLKDRSRASAHLLQSLHSLQLLKASGHGTGKGYWENLNDWYVREAKEQVLDIFFGYDFDTLCTQFAESESQHQFTKIFNRWMSYV